MNERMLQRHANRQRVYWTLGSLALVAIHLGWEALDGGVRAHHLLARPDLPSISNWWGVLVVPVLAWICAGSIRWPALVAAMAYGAALAGSFTFGFGVEKYLFPGLFVISLFVATYRGQYVLGFALGMMATFGAVLPTLVAIIVAAFSWCAHAAFRLVHRLLSRRKGSAGRTDDGT